MIGSGIKSTDKPTTSTRKRQKTTSTSNKSNIQSSKETLTTQTKVEEVITTEFESAEKANLLKVICDQNTLCDYLDFVSKGVSSHPPHPILANVLLVVDRARGTLELTTNNLEFGTSAIFDVEAIADGKITVPLSSFTQIIKKFPPGKLSLDCRLKSEDNSQQGNEPSYCLDLSTVGNKSKRFEFAATTAETFPNLPHLNHKLISIPGNIFAAQLNSSLFAAAKDEVNKILGGCNLIVNIDSESGLATIETWTTDGTKLAFSKIAVSRKSKSKVSKSLNFTLPIKALKELERHINQGDRLEIFYNLIKENEISQTQNDANKIDLVMFEWGNFKLVTRTLSGQFPDCQKLFEGVSSMCQNSFAIEREALLRTLERFSVLTDKNMKIIELKLDSKKQTALLQIERNNLARGSEIHNIRMHGEDLELLLDTRQILEIVKAVPSSELLFLFKDSETALIITPSGKSSRDSLALETKYLLAPMSYS
jgi:DNA polymerase-3 subunit beta